LLFVRAPQDSWMPLTFRSGAALISVAASLAIAYRDTPLSFPMLARALHSLRQGWSLFMLKGAVSLYTTGNVVLLGLLAGPNVVAIFAGAEKIANAAASGVNPIAQAFYPRISYLVAKDRRNAPRIARLSLLMTVGSGLLLGLTLLIGAPFLVHMLLGARFDQVVPVLRVLSVLPPLIAASSVLGIQWMLPLRLDKQFNWIILAAGVVNILLSICLVPRYGQMGMASSVIVAEMIVTGSLIFVLRHRRLDPWSEQPQQEEAIAV
ncbi:MAG TPA: oligosaccharide flippase family protein, partial [Edaphobacter sp.]|nr:oligosaccharide flippase family protein [Edaphobacter sp.]